DNFALTPTYHVFDMYAAHQKANAVRTVISSPPSSYTRNGQPATMRGLNGSASLQGRTLTLSVTNADLKNPREAEISVRGATIKAVKGVGLMTPDLHAHNTFADPNRVVPKEINVAQIRNPLVYSFPPASVTRLDIELAG
ncbi:MAG TPA: alpha-L-arabinofuranosidase C-terminal domain-containing protein, partial [Pyrinomonadaceae bacterium]|nr:alpha-L-arabinofuranosidase C-terminal domain-containing protein [Pyrinomonadaceae bacterium]